jgi:hypothetical protein
MSGLGTYTKANGDKYQGSYDIIFSGKFRVDTNGTSWDFT